MVTLIIPTLSLEKANATAAAVTVNSGVEDVAVIAVHDTQHAGYTRTVNRGLRQVGDGHVCLLNDDVTLSDDWLAVLMLEMARRHHLGAWFAGPSGACRTPPQNTGRPGDKRKPRFVSHLAGFCLLIHPSGRQMLNEQFIHYGSDVDLQWDARLRGGRSLWVPSVYCNHELHAPIAEWWRADNQTLRKLWR